jgi:predicted ArsR family transcriptional regulator
VIGDPETLLFVRGAGAPVSADEAAAGLGVHRTVARDRLERLVEAGLLTTSFARRSGKTGPGAGRPAKLYAPAPETAALELPPRRTPALIGRLVDALPARNREQALHRAGVGVGSDLAQAAGLRPRAGLARGAEQVCVALRSLGFQAAVERVDGDTAVITTPTCPLRPLVTEQGDAVHIDRGMWAGLVENAVRGATAECETHSCHDPASSCSVVIRLTR